MAVGAAVSSLPGQKYPALHGPSGAVLPRLRKSTIYTSIINITISAINYSIRTKQHVIFMMSIDLQQKVCEEHTDFREDDLMEIRFVYLSAIVPSNVELNVKYAWCLEKKKRIITRATT